MSINSFQGDVGNLFLLLEQARGRRSGSAYCIFWVWRRSQSVFMCANYKLNPQAGTHKVCSQIPSCEDWEMDVFCLNNELLGGGVWRGRIAMMSAHVFVHLKLLFCLLQFCVQDRLTITVWQSGTCHSGGTTTAGVPNACTCSSEEVLAACFHHLSESEGEGGMPTSSPRL